MSQLVVVMGATGSQGGSVINALLEHPQYRIRGVTRDTEKDEAQRLRLKGVEMVSADMDDEASLIKAFAGANVIFAVTDFYATFRATDPWTAMNVEYGHGMNMAQAALQTPTLEHYIWSTLPSASRISQKRFFVPHFEAKARVDEYIKTQPSLASKTTFLWVSFYFDNIKKPSFRPIYSPVFNRYLVLLPAPETAVFAIAGDQYINIGQFVRGILARRSTSVGKYVFCNHENMPVGEYYARCAKMAGKEIQYVRIGMEDFCKTMPGYGLEMGVMLQFWTAYGDRACSGEDMISVQDLGIESELVGLEDAWRQDDWSWM